MVKKGRWIDPTHPKFFISIEDLAYFLNLDKVAVLKFEKGHGIPIFPNFFSNFPLLPYSEIVILINKYPFSSHVFGFDILWERLYFGSHNHIEGKNFSERILVLISSL